MADLDYIEHEGIVTEVSPHLIKVRIVNESACASCHAKGSCTAADLQDKIIDVYQSESNVQIGQKVMILGKKSLAPKAVLLAYIYPILIILAVLVTVFYLTADELLAGGMALAALVPYYLVIYLLKDKLKRTFSFTIKHQIN
ncbi:SoxR reducing system RseC family protein [Carboxylicivirga mesophila]|uniref:SoxR reducing system RseC family protein n=1 Tax=Carboxylicivirga mesophila TaxID=1166478 RepID=A0ABS5KFK2_9BACT|nr:SoxR reducing system RseC family protein [Carboxylicivirga mesophila]MBS2213637.1 SoxR reducing system RseC family protein [Carboxylicivirga mesophila]